MKKTVLFFLLIAFFSTLGSAQAPILTLKANLQASLDSIVKEQQLPGATAAIVLADGQLISLASGYADKEEKIAMPLGAQMLLGSVGKIFVSAVTLQLVDEGKIQLNDKVSKYFIGVDWYKDLPNAEDLTTQSLLNHTSGLPRYVFAPAFIAAIEKDPIRSWTPAECLAIIASEAPKHPVGQGWGYSDTNYILLGLIIEKVTQSSYYTQLEERIISAFHLRSTYPSTQRELPGITQGYIGENNFFKLPKKVIKDGLYAMNPQFEWTGGGLVTNVEDLAYFIKWLHTGKILSTITYDLLLSSVNFRTGQAAETGYGLGTFVWSNPAGKSFGHAGVMPGYFTHVEFAQEGKYAVAMQVNTDQSGVQASHQNVRRLGLTVEQFLQEQ
ncbi:MAG: beta-lactamase family protein [Saprospiraceae bacterium]|nr:beta-lactamase family protein [Saprospiraceae bacterium]